MGNPSLLGLSLRHHFPTLKPPCDWHVTQKTWGLTWSLFRITPTNLVSMTWTLLSYVAAETSTVRLAGNVMNLPLNNPVRLARQIASLDLLSGGRIELGLGAGIFGMPSRPWGRLD